MTDQELINLVASLAVAQQKTDEQMARTDKKMAKTDETISKLEIAQTKTDALIEKMGRRVDKVAMLVGNIANNQGDVAEEFFYRSLSQNPMLGDLHFDIIYRNLPFRKGQLEDEFDIVLVNEKSVGIIEVKQKAHPRLMDEMLEKKLPNFRALFPYYKDLTLYGAVASMVSNDCIVRKSQTSRFVFLNPAG